MAAKRTRRNPSVTNPAPTADALWVSSKVKSKFSKFKITKTIMDLITATLFGPMAKMPTWTLSHVPVKNLVVSEDQIVMEKYLLTSLKIFSPI